MVDLCVNPDKDSENGQLKIGMLTYLIFSQRGFLESIQGCGLPCAKIVDSVDKFSKQLFYWGIWYSNPYFVYFFNRMEKLRGTLCTRFKCIGTAGILL